MQLLKQSTSAIVLVGPVLDASGIAVTSAAIADFQLTKNGTTAAMSSNTISHSHNGHYLITLTTANTDTLGRLTMSVNNAAMAMPVFRWDVLTAAAFDALVTNGNIFRISDYTAPANSTIASIYALLQLTDSDVASIVTLLGTPAGASLAADIAAAKSVIDSISAAIAAGVELDSASRLAIWNELTTQSFTADSFGELLIISDGTNGREVKVTASNHIAADVHDAQPDGLSGSTEITNIQNASGYLLAVLAGACADPQTASETYAITVFGSTFTVDMAGQTSTGTRTAPTLTKV